MSLFYFLNNKRSMDLLFKLCLLILPITGCAEVFSWVDDSGRQHYSDKPQHNAVELSIQTAPRYHQIKRINDGDTLVLDDNTKIRLLGINTPEIAKRGQLPEAGGEAAKQWLIKTLANTRIKLRYDVERQDKYKRTLAYIFNENNENINLQLVAKGLASVTIYPPNLKYVIPLVEAQRRAKAKKRGIWGLTTYAPKKARAFDPTRHRGWQRIQGKITRIKRARKYIYLYLTPSFSLKIAKKFEYLFNDLNQFLGKKIEVHGWVKKNKQTLHLTVRHPSAIFYLP